LTAERRGPARYVPSGFVIRRIVNPISLALGAPCVVIRGRTSGRPIRVLVPPFTDGSARYFVAGGGETHWVRNLRAAGEAELRRGRSRERVRAVEVEGSERDRVVAAYRDRMGRRAAAYFAALPDLTDHPAFRLEPVEEPPV
jgi:deazaflavin-dependent oxidoreductase (nitroreductase family)